MKTLFATTALVMALAAPGFAQQATTPATDPAMTSPYLAGIEAGVRASNLLGKRIYVTEADTASMSRDAIADAATDWEDAGEISDIIISMTGDTEAVLIDFGGFLGMGEKTVAVSMAQLVMVPDADSADDFFIVFQGSKAKLEAAPAFNPDMEFKAAATEGGTSDTAQSQVPADGTAMAQTDSTGTAMQAGQMADFSVMTATDLVGKRVIGQNGEDVGEISAVSLGADNKIVGAVVDVGGFLGMGEKPVALDATMLTMTPDANGEMQFHIAMTQEQLEGLPTYGN